MPEATKANYEEAKAQVKEMVRKYGGTCAITLTGGDIVVENAFDALQAGGECVFVCKLLNGKMRTWEIPWVRKA